MLIIRIIESEKCFFSYQTFNQIKKNIPYMCEYKLIFKISKLWFMSKNYGCQIKFVKILVKKDKEEVKIDFID